ncbi:MAG: T9SS type A sorting domain-containing protein [Bacteroidota bacterium]|nr:T9SS type A sorting domain-containing protein [Bacteroidota bacterium]
MKTSTSKMSLLLVIGMLLVTFSGFATNITVGTKGGNGGVEVSGTWSAGSTVTVYDHMIIPAGQSLTIQEGVNVQIADTTLKIEMIVLGNLYCKGTAANPINITVQPNLVPSTVSTTRPFPGLWGSIICDATCEELLMLHTNIKYYGAATTNNSPSVMLHLYKNLSGQTEPYMNFRNNVNGKLVIEYCTFSNGMDDGIYIEGGNVIYAYNTLYQNGLSGGDATNLKAGTVADLGYNMYYSPNTNAFKLSNSGSRSPQCNVVVYNNTIVNAGWRRPTVKGGSIWYEAGVVAKTYNTLFVNDRFGIKCDGTQDPACDADYNFYYGYGQNCVNNFNAPTKGLFPNGAHDIYGSTAGSNDPLFVNYALSTDTMNSKLDPAWDFHLRAGSPTIGAGTTNITRHFGTSGSGITIAGVEYLSPEPSTTIGAFGIETNAGLISTQESRFEVYPNPVIEHLNIKLNSNSKATRVQVYSLLGSRVFDEAVPEGLETISLPVANLSNGIYYVSVKEGADYSVRRFIKE